MDYQDSFQLYMSACNSAEKQAAETSSTLHYDCISYSAVNSVLEQIYGENIPQNLLEESWNGTLDIIAHARQMGWEVIEIAPIGCSEHYGDGRAFLCKRIVLDKTGWTGWATCWCSSCTTPGKDPAQGITAPDGTEFQWGDGISRSGSSDAVEFVMKFFNCSDEVAETFIDEVQGKPDHINWE